jgi:hypothetical protein
MLGRRLTQWILLVGLTSCTSDPNTPGARPSDTIGASATGAGGAAGRPGAVGTGGNGGSAAGSAGRGGSVEAGSPGGGTAGGPDDGGDPPLADATDARRRPLPDVEIDVPPIIHDDAFDPIPCTKNRGTFGSSGLRAGGATPSAFATAYNAELDASVGAGPLLIVLSGVNDSTPPSWVGSFGGLTARDGGGVGFLGVHAEVAFTIGAARAIQIAPSDATFELNFDPPAGDVSLPIVGIELAGTLSNGCGSLSVTKAKLLVPTSAGTIAFHGSTIAALMGAPTETRGGQAASAWALELAGTAPEVNAPSVLDDGGPQ